MGMTSEGASSQVKRGNLDSNYSKIQSRVGGMPRGGARPGAGRPKGSLILKGVRIPQERKPVRAIHTLDAVETAEKRDRLATLSVEGRAAAYERLYEIVVGQQGTTAEQINACRALVAATMPEQPVAAVQVNVGQAAARSVGGSITPAHP